MSSLKNSSFGKRLRAFHQNTNENSPRRKRRRIDLNQDVPPSPSKQASSSSTTPLNTTTIDITNTPVRRQKVRFSGIGECGDRFVPSRNTTSIRASYSLHEEVESPIVHKSMKSLFPPDPARDQANDLYKSILRAELSTCSTSFPTTPSPSPGRIFAYKSAMTSPLQPQISPERLDNPFDMTYQTSPIQNETRSIMSQPRPQIRKVDRAPYRCLDAPDLSDDFYTNLVDWSTSGVLGVGLGGTIFLWRAENLSVARLCEVSEFKDEYSSVAWMKTENTLAVATYDGHLNVHDVNTNQLVRVYRNAHTKRIGSLSWTGNVLSSGSRDRSVQHRDMRDPSPTPFKTSVGHKQEVCGLKWSGDGGPNNSLLASGGNDNKICIWDLRGSKRVQTLGVPIVPETSGTPSPSLAGSMQQMSGDMPLFKFHQHKAAVKGLAWNPHLSGVLASGGGQRDRCIRFWNTANGTMLHEVDTGSQVCNLLWSINSNELVSTHGYSTYTVPNQICVWKYPTMTMVSSLVGHTQCVQFVALNPEGDTIVTGGGDQTLRFWSVFPGRTPPGKREDSVLNYDKQIR
ncbi:WD40 repeat-like protein [Marasmius fiardii PR-910]|nr:WD40 repeat-like protein [Marasmius fiardii PR-910]